MKTIRIRSLSIPALAFLLLAGNAAAQDQSIALLSTLEVPQLIGRAEPNDHARLVGHFTAVAEQFAAEARRHTSIAGLSRAAKKSGVGRGSGRTL